MCKIKKLHYEASFGEHVDITILVPHPTDVERIQKELQDIVNGATSIL